MAAEPGRPVEVGDVTVLGEPTTYVDGSERVLAEVIGGAHDRSSASDELARHIHDWPSRYHLARERSNLLRPLTLDRTMRILDLGAGTGALTRYLGESGAEVVGLEGNLERARVAALRCHDLDNVEIACGRPSDLGADDRFDLITAIGVLEYAAHQVGGAGGAPTLLGEARDHLRPGGVLALAIENQMGLKYLLGYPEDHVGEPWVGLTGYPGYDLRTWSRRALTALLERAGFPAQRWLFPFPDYKLPSVVLAEAAYDDAEAGQLVDQLVSVPIREFAFDVAKVCDERAAHQQFVDAGLGPDVANSFLVLAGDAPPTVDHLVDPDTLAWVFDRERLRKWHRVKRIRVDSGLTIETERLDGGHDPVADRWLTQAVEPRQRYHRGPTLEQQLRAACARRDLAAVGSLLVSWRQGLEAQAGPGPDRGTNPFCDPGVERVLPPDHLDVGLGNFVGGGGAERVDREWRADGGVSLDLASLRALLYFVEGALATGATLPWPDARDRRDLVAGLASTCGIPAPEHSFARLLHAEGSLQALVTGGEEAAIAADLGDLLSKPLQVGDEERDGVPSPRRRRWWRR